MDLQHNCKNIYIIWICSTIAKIHTSYGSAAQFNTHIKYEEMTFKFSYKYVNSLLGELYVTSKHSPAIEVEDREKLRIQLS